MVAGGAGVGGELAGQGVGEEAVGAGAVGQHQRDPDRRHRVTIIRARGRGRARSPAPGSIAAPGKIVRYPTESRARPRRRRRMTRRTIGEWFGRALIGASIITELACLPAPGGGPSVTTVAVVVPVEVVVEAPPGDAVWSIEVFQDALAPYGAWVEDPQYGAAFEPAVDDFSPYVDGYWMSTEQGLAWISDEPFAWACYHYGRWTWRGRWRWIPDTVWAPAWVDWREVEDVMAWAPLPPAGVDDGPAFGWHGGRGPELATPGPRHRWVDWGVLAHRVRGARRLEHYARTATGSRWQVGPSPEWLSAHGVQRRRLPARGIGRFDQDQRRDLEASLERRRRGQRDRDERRARDEAQQREDRARSERVESDRRAREAQEQRARADQDQRQRGDRARAEQAENDRRARAERDQQLRADKARAEQAENDRRARAERDQRLRADKARAEQAENERRAREERDQRLRADKARAEQAENDRRAREERDQRLRADKARAEQAEKPARSRTRRGPSRRRMSAGRRNSVRARRRAAGARGQGAGRASGE
ncbi:MAG: hypothetical protein IPL61_03935 [Myxococcales bacterium]|nr:hypothetical protein [Myxococcales bacterium]